MRRLLNRPTGDLLVLMFAGTVCAMVLASGFSVFIFGLLHPERDLSQSVNAIADVVNTLLGLTAGFVAGRTEAHRNVPSPDE